MSQYKLTYFGSRGRAEISRYLFALADVEYEEICVSKEDWPDLKTKMPFGQVPVLEVDGIMISESSAIIRFLARRFGMAGKGDIQQAIVDSYIFAIMDMVTKMSEVTMAFMMSDDVKKAESQKKFKEQVVPDKYSKFEAILSKSSSGYLVGDEITVADLVLFNQMSWVRFLVGMSDEELAVYPKIVAHEQKIRNLPKIVEHHQKTRDMPRIAPWIANKPKSELM